MGKRQKRWLKLIRKLHKLPIFFLGGKSGKSQAGKMDLLCPLGQPKTIMKAGPEKAVRPATHTAILYFPTTRFEIVNFNLK